MRHVLLVLVAACCGTLPLSAQVKDDPKDDKKDDKKEVVTAPVTEIAGKGLEQWIKEIGSTDPSKRENAMRTVLLFGPQKAYAAVPALIAQLKKHTPKNPIDLTVRSTGALSLSTALSGVKGPDPKYLRDTVAILRGFLKDPQAVVKMRALQALPRLGPDALAALPEVILLVRDPDTFETRQHAVQTLAALTADPKNLPDAKVLNALYKALDDSASQVRLAALQALARVGSVGELSQKTFMIRELEAAGRDPDPIVQIVSHLALMTVRQSITQDQLTAIARMLKHSDQTVRTQAAQALALAGAKGRTTGPSLLPLLDDPEPEVVSTAMSALVRLEYWLALPAIAKLLRHPNPALRAEAAKTLGSAGTTARSEAPAIMAALDDANSVVVASCIIALVRLEHTGAVPALLRLADDSKQGEEIKKAARDAAELIQKGDKKDKKGQ
jgi:HEAT repeat protein